MNCIEFEIEMAEMEKKGNLGACLVCKKFMLSFLFFTLSLVSKVLYNCENKNLFLMQNFEVKKESKNDVIFL